MANNQLKYTSKDYRSILDDLIGSIDALSDTWTSREDSDPGIVLVKLMASVGDMLSYNLDKQALEYYSPTVTQRKNASKLYELIGYSMHWYESATTTVNIENVAVAPKSLEKNYEYYNKYINCTTESDRADIISEYNNDTTITEKVPTDNISVWLSTIKNNYDAWADENKIDLRLYVADRNSTLNLYSQNNSDRTPYIIEPTTDAITDENNNILPTKTVYPGESVKYPAIQGSLKSVSFSPNKLRDNKYYIPTTDIDQNHMYLQCSSSATTLANNDGTDTTLIWFTKVDNLLTQTDSKLHFQFKVDDFDFPYIELSNYWDKSLDDNAVIFTLYYLQSEGRYGNINKNVLSYIGGVPIKRVSITHPENNTYLTDSNGDVIATIGKHPQTASEAYVDAQNYIMTYHTLVTIYDFERFTRRQKGMSNALAVDGQRANDLNDILFNKCANMTIQQLRDLLPEVTGSKSELATELYKRREIHYDFRQDNSTLTPISGEFTKFKDYGLNIHVVYGYFDTIDSEGNEIATLSNIYETVKYPYYLYKINTGDGIYNPLEKQLDKAIDSCRIVNVRPEYSAIRVFPWRCCGTIHLTKPVTKIIAETILRTVIDNLRNAFSPNNLEFGERVKYMDIINVITSSSDMIQYFDAGMGAIKLINFEQDSPSTNIESYFNSCSLMMYTQTFDENEMEYIINEDGSKVYNDYYKLLSIDSEYII